MIHNRSTKQAEIMHSTTLCKKHNMVDDITQYLHQVELNDTEEGKDCEYFCWAECASCLGVCDEGGSSYNSWSHKENCLTTNASL